MEGVSPLEIADTNVGRTEAASRSDVRDRLLSEAAENLELREIRAVAGHWSLIDGVAREQREAATPRVKTVAVSQSVAVRGG